MGMDRTGFKRRITCKINNKTDTGCPPEYVGDCGKVRRENGAKEFPDGGTHKCT